MFFRFLFLEYKGLTIKIQLKYSKKKENEGSEGDGFSLNSYQCYYFNMRSKLINKE